MIRVGIYLGILVSLSACAPGGAFSNVPIIAGGGSGSVIIQYNKFSPSPSALSLAEQHCQKYGKGAQYTKSTDKVTTVYHYYNCE